MRTYTKTKRGNISRKEILLAALPFLFLFCSCNDRKEQYTDSAEFPEIKKTGEIDVSFDSEPLAEVLEGLVVSDELDVAYGVDLRLMRAYELSLLNGEVRYLAPVGKGPGELFNPVQIIKKSKNELLIFDTGVDAIAEYKDGSIMKKYTGFSEHGVWVRNLNGYYLYTTS